MSESDHYLEAELAAALRTRPEVFRILRMASLDGMWYRDLENPEHEWLSPGFWRLLGYDPAEKEHRASEWQDLLHPDDLARVLESFERHRDDPSYPYDLIVRYRHKDGGTVWVRCRGMMIRDSEGVPVRMLGAHTDVTALKEAEEELLRRNAELERVNAALTEALDRIETLRGMIPICSWCQKVRDDEGDWERVENFVKDRSLARFTHTICPECTARMDAESGGLDEPARPPRPRPPARPRRAKT